MSLRGQIIGAGPSRCNPESVGSAGNAVVIKPSELSENMANLLATIIPQYVDKVRFSAGLKENCGGPGPWGIDT